MMDSQGTPLSAMSRTKDDQLRQIQIDKAKLEMELAKKLMEKKENELTNLRNMLEEANNIVTVQEVNRAEEEYERAKAAYEDAKLNLQNVELESLKTAWHITILDTRRYEARDGREMFSITLKNSSLPVKLEESSIVLGREVIISAQIDDIFVSIKGHGEFSAQGAIVAIPYEVRIPSLKEGEEKTLEFELVKDELQDVVVSLKYLDIEEDRNIHLKQEEPYISVLSARRYKEEDRRRLELVLKYGAVLGDSPAESERHGGNDELPVPLLKAQHIVRHKRLTTSTSQLRTRLRQLSAYRMKSESQISKINNRKPSTLNFAATSTASSSACGIWRRHILTRFISKKTPDTSQSLARRSIAWTIRLWLPSC